MFRGPKWEDKMRKCFLEKVKLEMNIESSEWKSGMLGFAFLGCNQSTVSIGMKVREWGALEAIARALSSV